MIIQDLRNAVATVESFEMSIDLSVIVAHAHQLTDDLPLFYGDRGLDEFDGVIRAIAIEAPNSFK